MSDPRKQVWALRIPFEISASDSINLDTPGMASFGEFEVVLDHTGPIYHFTITGFPTQEAAAAALDSIVAAIRWVGIQSDIGVVISGDLELGEQTDDPEAAGRGISKAVGAEVGPIDAYLSGNNPVVFRADWRTRFFTGFPASLIHGRSKQRLLEHFEEGVGMVGLAAGKLPEHVLTALDLMNAQRHESSTAAKLLTITTVLEVLSPDLPKHESALDLIQKWREELRTLRETSGMDAHAQVALDSLEKELLFRRGMSLRGRVRELAYATAPVTDVQGRSEYARKALSVYDVRSELAHRGRVEGDQLQSTVKDAHEIAVRAIRHAIASVRADHTRA